VQKVALQENFSSKNFLAGKINLMKLQDNILTEFLNQEEALEEEAQEEVDTEEVPEETEETESEDEEW